MPKKLALFTALFLITAESHAMFSPWLKCENSDYKIEIGLWEMPIHFSNKQVRRDIQIHTENLSTRVKAIIPKMICSQNGVDKRDMTCDQYVSQNPARASLEPVWTNVSTGGRRLISFVAHVKSLQNPSVEIATEFLPTQCKSK